MEMSPDQRERLKTAMDRYKLFVDHGVPLWEGSDIETVNSVRGELGMEVHTNFNCGRCIPELVFKDVYRLYEQTNNI